MRKIGLIALLISFYANAAGVLNCHTDAIAIGHEMFKSYDMTFPIEKLGVFNEGGKLYTNTFPPSTIHPNPHLRVKTDEVNIKDALVAGTGRVVLYFTAGNNNFVLDVKSKTDTQYEGEFRLSGERREKVQARCYIYKTYP